MVPALAIARALVDRGHDPFDIRFIGSKRGIEATLVPAAGFELTLLPGRGIARRPTKDNIGAVFGLVTALVRAVGLIRRLRPAVTVAVGGYASAPAALASLLWRVPVVVAEQNAVPGLANRLAGRFAVASAVSFEGTPLPRSVVTGNPVRKEIVEADRSPAGRRAAREELGLPADSFVVVVAGGSLGARHINRATLELVSSWAGPSGVCIYHVVGRRDFEEVAAARPVAVPPGLDYRQVEFEERMPLVLTAADVTLQRAGASTVAELTVLGLPSVLVPLPGAPGDHQMVNARRLADAGAAVLVPDAELTAERLRTELGRLHGSPELLDSMAAAARALGRPDAATRVALLVESAVGASAR